jgi:hypothetical protein
MNQDRSSCSLGYGHEARGARMSSPFEVACETSKLIADNIGRMRNHRVTSPSITVWTCPGKAFQCTTTFFFIVNKFDIDINVSYNHPREWDNDRIKPFL